MSNFLGRNKNKQKRDKNAAADCADYIENPEKLKQKFIEKTKVFALGGCDFLISVRATTLSRTTGAGGGRAGDVDAALALFLLPEDARVLFVPFEFTAQGVEAGPHRSLDELQKIYNEESSTTLGLLFSSASGAGGEVAWRITHYTDRDDFAWVLSQLSKQINGVGTPTSGYLPELNMAGKGWGSKYPALFALLSASVSTAQEDEKEAELLLEQLDWTKPVPELQSKLKDDIFTLNVEICDLLLQWEDDEAEARPGRADFASNRIRDTVELLTTLEHVDKELGFVNDWLGNQIDHLSSVQMEIKQIEHESGTLETSLQNLTSVKALVASIVKGLQLSRTDEEVLGKAEKTLKQLLAGPMTNADMEAALGPLGSALLSLKNALLTNEDSLGGEYSSEDWDQLKLVSGIMEQRQRLNNIVFNFCSSVGDFMTSLFSGILKHRGLNDTSRASTVLVKRFSFSTVQFEVMVCKGRAPPSLPAQERAIALQQKNQILSAQRCFHETVILFLPILEHTLVLNPSLTYRMLKSYVDATQQYLYGPLLRQLFKEITQLTSTQHPVCFASLPRGKSVYAGGKALPQDLQKFRELGLSSSSSSLGGQSTKLTQSQGGSSLHIWDTVLMTIMITAPVIEREELFFQGILPSTESSSEIQNSVREMFSGFRERIIKISSSTEQVNAVEIIAMLVFFESIQRLQSLLHQTDSSAATLGDEIDVGVYTFPRSFRMPNFVMSVISEARETLSGRLDQFTLDEVGWLQSGKGGLSDAKMLGVSPAVSKFPVYLDIIEELVGSQSFPFTEKFLITVGNSLLSWLCGSAAMNEKYRDAILIQNLAFLEVTINSRSASSSFPALASLLEESSQKLFEAEKNYLDWMIEYEMPSFWSLSKKIDGVEKRANREELSIYVRRQDVIKVMSGLSAKSVEASISVMRKRLDKHFGSSEASELGLIPKMWAALEDRLHSMFVSMELIVHASYQLSLAFRPDALLAIFDKHKS